MPQPAEIRGLVPLQPKNLRGREAGKDEIAGRANGCLGSAEPLCDDRALRRAGLDYWREVDVKLWDSLDELFAAAGSDARFFFLTTKAKRAYWDERFEDGDYLVFGRETKGLPEPLLAARAESCVTIPMTRSTRSLNLATAVGIVLYEAIRQIAPTA